MMLSVKQGGIKYLFFKSLVWLNLGLTLVSQTIGEQSNHYANGMIYIYIYIYIYIKTSEFNKKKSCYKLELPSTSYSSIRNPQVLKIAYFIFTQSTSYVD